MNSARVAAGKPLLGFVNPLLYSANISANSVSYASNFYDITSGTLFCVWLQYSQANAHASNTYLLAPAANITLHLLPCNPPFF